MYQPSNGGKAAYCVPRGAFNYTLFELAIQLAVKEMWQSQLETIGPVR